jgi:hypothetical protein
MQITYLTCKFIAISIFITLMTSHHVEAQEPAKVACRDFAGDVYIYERSCPFGMDLVSVMNNPQVAPQPYLQAPSFGNFGSYGGRPARVACRSLFGEVTIYEGSCPFGDDLIQVVN